MAGRPARTANANLALTFNLNPTPNHSPLSASPNPIYIPSSDRDPICSLRASAYADHASSPHAAAGGSPAEAAELAAKASTVLWQG